MIVAEKRFSQTADNYDQYRPDYPDQLINWLWNNALMFRGAKVADIGCGTGIASRRLTARGLDVTGVEPNEDMIERARRRGGGPQYVVGRAQDTGLPGASFDMMVCAQAFHWFYSDEVLREFRRVLKPGGWGCVFWNVRGGSQFMDRYDELLADVGEYSEVPKPRDALNWLDEKIGRRRVLSAEFVHAQPLSREEFLGRVASSSYVANGVKDQEKFLARMLELFEGHARNGRIDFCYRAVARMWQEENHWQ